MSDGPSSAPRNRAFPVWLVFPLAAALLLWPVLFAGQVLLPADYLKAFAPWSRLHPTPPEQLPQWNVLLWDGLAQFYPWRLELSRAFAEGRVPLWNPYLLSGTPFLANSQSAPLYPFHALFALPLGTVAARMAWLDWLHLSLAGLFTYHLARGYGLRTLAALTAGLAFELSGFAVAWLELPSFITVACWIPLVMLCTARAARTGTVRWAFGLGLAAGMMLLGGHLQIALYGLMAAGLTWIWEAAGLARSRPRLLGRAALLAAGGIAGGIALSAAQLLPTLELSRISHRVAAATEAGYGDYLKLALPPQNWITLLVPDYYGLPGTGNFWGYWSYLAPNTVEYAGHVGAVGLVLAVVGALALRRHRSAGLPLLLGGFALLLAAGSPLSRLLYFYVPGFSQSGSPARVLVLFCLAQALLAGCGVERLTDLAAGDLRRFFGWLTASVTLSVGLILGFHFLAQNSLPPGLDRFLEGGIAGATAQTAQPALIRAISAALSLWVVLMLLGWLLRENAAGHRARAVGGAAAVMTAGVLLWIAGPFNPIAPAELVYPDTPVTNALKGQGARVATLNRNWELADYTPAVLPPNSSLPYRWREASGYDSLALGPYRRLASAVAGAGEDAAPPSNGNIAFIKNPKSPLLPLLAAKLAVSLTSVTAPGLRPAPGFPAGPPFVYEVVNAVPEGYTVSGWFQAEDEEAARRLRELPPGELANGAAVAPGETVPPWKPEALEPAPGVPALVKRIAPGRIRVEAQPKLPSLLVLAESWAPGWKVRVQERGRQARDASAVRVNLGFQGVFVGSGPVTAEWRYEPNSYRVGLWISLAALAVLLGGLAAAPRGKGQGECE